MGESETKKLLTAFIDAVNFMSTFILVIIGLLLLGLFLIYFFSFSLNTILEILLLVELILLFIVFFSRANVLDVLEKYMKLNSSTISRFYYILTLSLFLPILTLTNYFFPQSLFVNCVLIIGIGILWVFTVKENEAIFKIIIPKPYREKVGYFDVSWHSREFEVFVGQDVVDLYNDTDSLIGAIREKNTSFSDYSFIVFPLAKAYEGILKKLLVEMGFIKKSQLLQNPDVSINSYFNPAGNTKIAMALKDKARDKAIPYLIYSTYSECRNQILHYDPYRDNRLKSIEEAEFFIRRIIDATNKAYETFKKH